MEVSTLGSHVPPAPRTQTLFIHRVDLLVFSENGKNDGLLIFHWKTSASATDQRKVEWRKIVDLVID